ncbi:outer membrane beta-barrel protein [Pedobacter sp. V48]|uniref:outer membrane beta-barrel protein n=1 Tax=Pedobacter sp. V48 TaxID=509635 RepID=UPI0003E560E7|nr:outer membrane beta-barrel protein [Pedobacter sp. V48]ETZ23056.1 hypothetical protein N824_20685 [Pedobacter sp. V48]
MNRNFSALAILIIFPFVTMAQKGSNFLQVAGQATLPTGNFSDVVKTGFGGSVKGIYGFSTKPQAITLEAGYNSFAVKNLPAVASGDYSLLPVYAGYRADLSGLILESQAGVSFNRVALSVPGESHSDTQTAFGWALSAGYAFKNVEFSLRYQHSEGSGDYNAIRVVGIRLGYKFGL